MTRAWDDGYKAQDSVKPREEKTGLLSSISHDNLSTWKLP